MLRPRLARAAAATTGTGQTVHDRPFSAPYLGSTAVHLLVPGQQRSVQLLALGWFLGRSETMWMAPGGSLRLQQDSGPRRGSLSEQLPVVPHQVTQLMEEQLPPPFPATLIPLKLTPGNLRPLLKTGVSQRLPRAHGHWPQLPGKDRALGETRSSHTGPSETVRGHPLTF